MLRSATCSRATSKPRFPDGTARKFSTSANAAFSASSNAIGPTPQTFSIHYPRRTPSRSLAPQTARAILQELATSKPLIENKTGPIRAYPDRAIQATLAHAHGQTVSLSTIIYRAKPPGYSLKRPTHSAHDRQVRTQDAGQLVPHDSSCHLWAPDGGEK